MIEVLVVDDDPDALKTIRRELLRQGFAVVDAKNAAEALVAMATAVPDVVVTDNVSGGGMVRAIRAMLGEVAVVVFSGDSDAASRMNFLGEGANAYLSKVDILALGPTLRALNAESTRADVDCSNVPPSYGLYVELHQQLRENDIPGALRLAAQLVKRREFTVASLTHLLNLQRDPDDRIVLAQELYRLLADLDPL